MSDTYRDTAWYLAQMKPNSHVIANRNLTQQGFETFLPLQEETKRVRDRFVTRRKPFFPGYIFVALDVKQGSWRAVNSTIGVTRLVSLGGTPTPLPDALVSELMARCDADGKLLPPRQLQPGDEVTLTKGPFADFVATVERITPDRRVWVLMEMMGAHTRLAIDAELVRPLHSSPVT